MPDSLSDVLLGLLFLAIGAAAYWIPYRDRPRSGYYNSEKGRARRRTVGAPDPHNYKARMYLASGVSIFLGVALLARGCGHVSFV